MSKILTALCLLINTFFTLPALEQDQKITIPNKTAILNETKSEATQEKIDTKFFTAILIGATTTVTAAFIGASYMKWKKDKEIEEKNAELIKIKNDSNKKYDGDEIAKLIVENIITKDLNIDLESKEFTQSYNLYKTVYYNFWTNLKPKINFYIIEKLEKINKDQKLDREIKHRKKRFQKLTNKSFEEIKQNGWQYIYFEGKI